VIKTDAGRMNEKKDELETQEFLQGQQQGRGRDDKGRGQAAWKYGLSRSRKRKKKLFAGEAAGAHKIDTGLEIRAKTRSLKISGKGNLLGT